MMNKNNDRWSALSMKDRAALIDIYVKSGITDLGEIRKDYNSYDFGGVKDKIYNVGYDKIIKPTIDELGISEVRKRLYNNITPLTYAQPIKRVYNAIIKDRPYNLIKNPEVETNVNYDRDDIWAEYLQIPESERHEGPTKKVGYSNYTPSKSSFKHSKYRNIELDDEDKKKLLDAAFFGDTFYDSKKTVSTKGIKVGESEITNALKKYFGTHTVSRGFDDKGEYISYYDLWDLAPLSILGIDESKGIGKPIEFYDRIYLDDYYNIPEEFRGKPFISPSVVEATRNSFGDGGDTEPLYYDDTYIEPAVVKAFKSTEDYNRYQGRKGAKAVRRGINKAANTISEGLRYTPVVGDVMDGLEAYEEAKTGNLTKAGVLAGLALLPNALEKPVKAVSKPLKRYLTHGIDNDLFTLSMRKWKGSPMPSMSVNDLDIPIFDYGDMTFIGSEDLLDNSIIFRGDGMTPTVGTVGGNEMMDPQEVIKRMKEQQKRKGEYNIGQIISKEEASTLPMRGGTEDYFEAKYQDFIPWNKFKHLVTKGELHPDLIKLIEDVGIPHTNVPEENYLEAIRKIAEEMNLVFNNGGKLNKFITGGPTKNNWEIPFSLESTTVPITNYDYYTFAPETVQIPISALKEKYAMAPELIARNDEKQLRELKERASKEYSYGIKSKILDNIGKQEEVNKSMLRSGYHNNQPDNYRYTNEGEVDTSKQIKITAPNTNISKFIYGNTITEEALKEIKRVASTRNLDPYDILAHMLIESSGKSGGITSNTYFNTHDVLKKQINPKLLDINNSRSIETLLKNLGVYDPAKQYTNEQIRDYILNYIKQLKEANANVEYPTSTIDAVGLRMSKFGRDFNPAQKGFKSDLGEIKHSYLEMIDSAITSLKENMPDLFK